MVTTVESDVKPDVATTVKSDVESNVETDVATTVKSEPDVVTIVDSDVAACSSISMLNATILASANWIMKFMLSVLHIAIMAGSSSKRASS